MLNKHLARVLGLVLADPARVPKFTRNAEILAAAHQRVRPAAFCSGGDAVRGEVVLFAAGDGDEAGVRSVLAEDSGLLF